MATAVRTAALLRFNEAADYVRPVDEAGSLSPLFVPAGLTAPAKVDGIVGGARAYTAARGFHGTEAVAGSTRLLRDVTLEAIVDLPWASTDGTYRIVTRGKGTSAAERELYGLQVVATGGVVQLQMRWQRSSGAAATVPAVTVEPPSGWLYAAAVRRWVSTTEVVVDYYLNGEHAGQVTSAHGDLADGIGGTMLIGTDATPTGMPSGSVIDDIRISRVARTGEEIRQQFRRMFVYGDYGYDLLRSLQPPGDTWSQDPDSRIQRFFRVAGDALGQAWSAAAQVLEDFLPDRAWSFLDRWEAVLRLQSKATDSVQTRRSRVIAFMRKVHGYSRAKVLDALVEMLDVTSASDLSIVENSNTWLDDFSGSSIGGRWQQEKPAAGHDITQSAGVLALSQSIGDDSRWTGMIRGPVSMRTSIEETEGAEVVAHVAAFAPTADGIKAGLFVWNQVTGDAHLYGFKRDAGVVKFFHATIVDGVYTEAIGANRPAGTTWMLRYTERGGVADLDYVVDPADFNGPWLPAFSAVATIEGGLWTGGFLSDDAAAATADAFVAFEDFRVFAPNGRVVFQWFVYRDPALGGFPDFDAAQQIIDKTKPAHTIGGIIESTDGALYDTAPHAYDRSPLGG
jgi:hypothetical protein